MDDYGLAGGICQLIGLFIFLFIIGIFAWNIIRELLELDRYGL